MTRKYYDEQLDALHAELINMGQMISGAIGKAVAALLSRDTASAREVIAYDAEVDRQIEEGRRALAELRAANDDIESPVISAQLDRMERAARAIFDRIEQEPRKALQVRRFMNYYLPTCVKLLGHYRDLDGAGISGENMEKSKKCIEDSLEMIACAFEKQLDNLFSDQALDISTDIQVLETMMAGEGLTDSAAELKKDSKGAAQAGR